MMRESLILAIGSTNQPKIQAVKEVIRDYAFLAHGDLQAIEVNSGISDQPLTLEETILGAKNRAAGAFQKCKKATFGFGIESGLIVAVGAATGYLSVGVCSVYDGKCHHIGLSRGFEVPFGILKLVLEKKINLNQACYESGITTSARIGKEEGLIGLLTQGRVTRQQYCQECVASALIQLENDRRFYQYN